MDMVVCVELWVGRLTINSSNIENGFEVCISSWELTSRAGTGRSAFDSPPLIEMVSFCNIFFHCFTVNLAVHDLQNVKVNHYSVNLYLVDSVRVCVYVCVFVCMVCMYACWVVSRG